MKDYSQYGFREHGIMLYLDKTLYKAFIKLQADKGLGRSYAGLLPFVEGLYHLGYLSKEEYETHFQKYNTPLTEEPKPLTKEQMQEREKLKKLNKNFSMVIEQWNLHPSLEWRLKWIKQAEKWKDKIPSAKALLDLADKEVTSNASKV